MIPVSEVLHERVYTFVRSDNTIMHFAADRINKWLLDNPREPVLVETTPAIAKAIWQNNNLEKHRLDRIKGPIKVPVVFVQFEDGTHTLIDGSHRYVSAFMQGHSELQAHILTKEDYEPFLIDDPVTRAAGADQVRAALRKVYSGID